MRHLVFVSIILILFSACVPVTPVQPVSRIPFPLEEYQALSSSGTATVKGQAFLKARGGDVKFAAGSVVLLNPVTSYSLEWYEKSYLTDRPMGPADSRIWNFIRKQTANENGRFVFNNVPPGEYFVTTLITWEEPAGFQGELRLHGGVITKRIAVHDGDNIDIIVTR